MPWPDDGIGLEFAVGALLLAGILLYALLGGADFGGGVWDLFARGPRKSEQRSAVARAIGPVWEANHVWLIFVIVVVFSCYPHAFSSLSTALFIPFTLAMLGIVFRGAAFVFRGYAYDLTRTRAAWGRVFAIASTITPILFGMCAGAVASGDIEISDGKVTSSLWTPWLKPFPIVIGALALALCAYLAAVYLTLETDGELQDDFRRRALAAGRIFALLALVALVLSRWGAPYIWDRLTSGWGVVVVLLALALAAISGWAVYTRRFLLARGTAAAEVALLLIGWASAQYPYLIVDDMTYKQAAASHAMLKVFLIVFAIGSVFLIPSLVLLFSVFKGMNPATDAPVDREPATSG